MFAPLSIAVLGEEPAGAALRSSALAAGLRLTDDQFGAAVVAIAHHDHRSRLASAVMSSGRVALLPPPICTTLGDADALVEADRVRAGWVAYAEPILHAPLVARVLDDLPRLGAITHLEARAISAASTEVWSADELVTLIAHPLALVTAIANAAGHGRPCGVEAHRDVDGLVEVRLRHSTGLVSSVVAGTGRDHEQHWDLQVAGQVGVRRIALLPQPQLEVDGDTVSLPPEIRDAPPEMRMGMTAMWTSLAESRGATQPPVVGAQFGREILQLLVAAGASIGDAQEIAVPWSGARDRSLSEFWRRP